MRSPLLSAPWNSTGFPTTVALTFPSTTLLKAFVTSTVPLSSRTSHANSRLVMIYIYRYGGLQMTEFKPRLPEIPPIINFDMPVPPAHIA